MHRVGLSLVSACIIICLLWSFQSTRMETTARESSAVGISLAANHGTISVRHDDGSFKDISRIDGDEHYFRVIQRLSSPCITHPSPPYHDLEEMWKDWPRQAWRSARKRAGRPASSDVGVLVDMLKRLADTASSYTGPIVSAVISYPSAICLYQEDIVDAAEYLSLRALKGNHFYQPREMVAAYAGHGMGLCKSFKDKEKCTTEGLKLPERDVLLVEYTEVALLLHGGGMREAIDLATHDFDEAASFKLGSKAVCEKYGALKVQEFVLQFLRRRYRFLEPPQKMTVIMTGSEESVQNSEVQEAVKTAVEEMGSAADMLTSLPEYIAARGAAELAWRAQVQDERMDL
ncbi:hypothetical protein GQ43DRAFT_481388 [Delitschia confertaspora ATCC 74209]|uniref:Uncharacterized protein n=1 Tax=Delitschia confertaspora ATCC 74209 TaxID=1513339 RepID=A0A9P4JLV2_9PLEO|nr:hypothetical protein GQ43DRAFT_481388 [Delitschia confertaspora ATCC 74209]